MTTPSEVFELFTTGNGRLISAGALFVVIFLVQKLPWVGAWMPETELVFA